METVRAGIISDHAALAIAVSAAAALEARSKTPHITVVKATPTVNAFLAAGPGVCDVVVLDLSLADKSDPADNVARLTTAGYMVLALTPGHDLELIRVALANGARAVSLESEPYSETIAKLQRVAAGETVGGQEMAAAVDADGDFVGNTLSNQERECLALYAAGFSQPQVARRLGIAESSVNAILKHIREKYDKTVHRTGNTTLYLRQPSHEFMTGTRNLNGPPRTDDTGIKSADKQHSHPSLTNFTGSKKAHPGAKIGTSTPVDDTDSDSAVTANEGFDKDFKSPPYLTGVLKAHDSLSAPPVTVHIYLDTDDAVTSIRVIMAMGDVLESAGYGRIRIESVESGSIRLRIKGWLEGNDGQKAKQKLEEAASYAEQWTKDVTVNKQRAEVSAINAHTAHTLMQSVKDIDNVAMQIDEWLLIKHKDVAGDSQCSVRKLTVFEMQMIERTPSVLNNPSRVLENLALLAYQEQDSQLAPES